VEAKNVVVPSAAPRATHSLRESSSEEKKNSSGGLAAHVHHQYLNITWVDTRNSAGLAERSRLYLN